MVQFITMTFLAGKIVLAVVFIAGMVPSTGEAYIFESTYDKANITEADTLSLKLGDTNKSAAVPQDVGAGSPVTMILIGSGLIWTAGWARRKFRK